MTNESKLPEPEQQPIPRRTGRLLLISFLLSVLALVLLAWLADEVLDGQTRHFDLYVRLWAHQWTSHGLTVGMTILSQIGSALFLGIATVLLALRFEMMRWRRAAKWLVLAMVGAAALDLTLKLVFHRTRPQPFFGGAPHSYSFPSGHALASFCFYGVLAGLISGRVRNRTVRAALWMVAAALIVGIGFSRIYLGVHYPTDVVAGYLAATVWVGALVSADHWRARRRE
jgi:undecaprenyl-diphosphatase